MYNTTEEQYLDLLHEVMFCGNDTDDRTGVGTRSIFGAQLFFDLSNGFPAITTKKLAWKAVVSELLWFLEGSTDERRLCEIRYGSRDPRRTTIWTANADNQGAALGYENNHSVKQLGPIYGHQWRNFRGVDQIQWVLQELVQNPSSRRLVVSAWNPADMSEMALPPCHTMFQFYVHDNKLSCQLYQRSADLFLGSPFNIASYSLLTHMFAQICGYGVGEFVYTLGDAHIYHNHFDAVTEQLKRVPYSPPTLCMPEFSTLDELLSTNMSDYQLEGYDHHPPIKAPMAV